VPIRNLLPLEKNPVKPWEGKDRKSDGNAGKDDENARISSEFRRKSDILIC